MPDTTDWKTREKTYKVRANTEHADPLANLEVALRDLIAHLSHQIVLIKNIMRFYEQSLIRAKEILSQHHGIGLSQKVTRQL